MDMQWGSETNLPGDPRIGPTGDYPAGSIGDHDEGGLNAALAVDQVNQRVVLDFGKPVAWLAMTRSDAMVFAQLLINKAKQLPG
jgi:hypothetical protein